MKYVAIASLLLLSATGHALQPRMSHGARQLAGLLEDRPAMKEALSSEDSAYQWALSQLEEGMFGKRIYWDGNRPKSGRPAEHQWTPNYVVIRISDSRRYSGVDQWTCLIFELENARNVKAFEELQKQVRKRTIGREEFAIQCVRLEHNACNRTRRLLDEHPLPGASVDGDPLYASIVKITDDFNQYIRYLDSRGPGTYDPRVHFGNWFDALSSQARESVVAARQFDVIGRFWDERVSPSEQTDPDAAP